MKHPNVVTFGDLVEHQGVYAFTMELVDGVDLIRHVRPDGAPGYDEARVRSAFAQLASALGALHGVGLVHRDVKPSNVCVAPSGRLVLVDFGLVAGTTPEGALTVGSVLLGTPAYAAPEQGRGSRVGTEADWYAFGCALYQALTGTLPFSGTTVEIMLAKSQRDGGRPSGVAENVPPDLDALCVALLRAAPEQRANADDVRRVLPAESPLASIAPPRTSEVPFVGRDPELAALDQAFRASLGGAAQLVLVEGESGIGKSRLVLEHLSRIRRERPDALVLAGRCYESELLSYQGLDPIIDGLARWLAEAPDAPRFMPTRRGDLARVFPTLRRVADIARAPVTSAVDGVETRTRAFAALRELFDRITRDVPVVLAIDDLQWADADSFTLLDELLRPPEEPPLLVLATRRAVAASGDAGVLARARRVALAPFAQTDARDLAQRLLSRAQTAGDAEEIAREAAGHPLFIETMVRYGAAHGARGRLHELLVQRIRELPPDERTLLALVAAADGPVEATVLRDAAELSAEAFHRAMRTLRAEQLVATVGASTDERFETYHDRIRAAALAGVGGQAELHRALARAMERSADPDADRLASHWLAAGDDERALSYVADAADRALSSLAFEQAVVLYQRAIAHASSAAVARATWSERLGDAYASLGRSEPAANAYLAAADPSDAVRARELRRRAAEQLLRGGYIERGLTLAREGLEEIGLAVPATLWRAVVELLWLRCALFVALRRVRLTEPRAASSEERGRLDTCWTLGHVLGLTDAVRGAVFTTRALVMALRLGDRERTVRALSGEMLVRASAGQRAAPSVERLYDLGTTLSSSRASSAWLAAGLGLASYNMGRYEECRACCRRALDVWNDEPGAFWEAETVRSFELFALAQLGDLGELRVRRASAARSARERSDRYGTVVFSTGDLALLWLADDEPARAREEVSQAMSGWTTAGFHLVHFYELVALTHVDLYEERAEEALARVESRWKSLGRSLLRNVGNVRVQTDELRARALLACAAGERGAARDVLLRRARSSLAALGRDRWSLARAKGDLLLGVLALHEGRAGPAQALLARASDAFAGLGMRLYALVAELRRAEAESAVPNARARRATDALAERGVRRPLRFASVLAPGPLPESSRRGPDLG
jgi:tetratricopeptide (TPR) repeat protein